MFNKVLVANRGEIACRILRTLRRLGIKSAAVYSDADAGAPHVKLADEAHYIGPPTTTESYLNAGNIVSVARECGAEAVHPGYGFLSENASFARAVAAAGMVFIGPPAEAMAAIGSKRAARRLLAGSAVPLMPSADLPADPSEAMATARGMGFPVIVKPSSGGGGKGATVVHSEAELGQAIESARGISQRHFGTGAVHLEKFLEHARHIEIQVLADHYGNALHIMERECSWQRRYQKIVEESPSMAVSPLLRRRLAEAALSVVRASGYENAGTIEFLADDQNSFYFLETNCRIQVEHPVTEMITGLDLVELQLLVASGRKLALRQDDIRAQGHAIEARIYAEDPETFLPATGRISSYREPWGPGVRVDSGVAQGYEVSPYYDPMLAKLICWGESREKARAAALDALGEFAIEGVTTNIPLLVKILSHPAFISGEYHTAILTPEFVRTPVAEGAGNGLKHYWRYGS